MAQVYLVARRKEVQDGSVQITDLFPNKSQASAVIDPAPQGPVYVRTPDMGVRGAGRVILSVDGNGAISFASRSYGLISYLMRNVEHGDDGSISITEAVTAANAIIARVRAGSTLQVADINGILDTATGSALTVLDDGAGQSDSTATVEGILRILAGEKYEVASGSKIEDANQFVPVVSHEAGFQKNQKHLIPNDSSWQISLSEGQLKGLTTVVDAVNGDLYAGVRSTSPLISVYENDGTLFSL